MFKLTIKELAARKLRLLREARLRLRERLSQTL